LTPTPVNLAPTVAEDVYSVDEDARGIVFYVLSNDRDPEGAPLTIQSVTQPANARIDVVNNNSALAVTLSDNYFGNLAFSYVASDGILQSTGQVRVTVLPVNDPPQTTQSPPILSVQENQTIRIDLLRYVTDIDNPRSELQVMRIIDAPKATVTLNGNTVIYTPLAEPSAPESASPTFLRYEVADQEDRSEGILNINIQRVNDAPTPNNDSFSVPEDANTWSIDVLSNDTDIDTPKQNLKISSIGTAEHGSVEITGGGLGIAYTPNPNYSGTDRFTYTIFDGTSTGSAMVFVNVTPINDAPVANNLVNNLIEISLKEDSEQITISVLQHFADADNDELFVSLLSAATLGEATTDSKSVFYKPLLNQFGEDSVTLRISDGKANGYVDATLKLLIEAVPDAPTANDVTVETVAGQSVPIDLSAAVSDVDSDSSVLYIADIGTPLNGAVVLNSNLTLTYTPSDGFSGSDEFYYIVSDGVGNAPQKIIRVVVNVAVSN
jgi:hypothetical protein